MGKVPRSDAFCHGESSAPLCQVVLGHEVRGIGIEVREGGGTRHPPDRADAGALMPLPNPAYDEARTEEWWQRPASMRRQPKAVLDSTAGAPPTGPVDTSDVDASVPQSVPTGVMNFDECEVRASLTDQSGGRIEGFSFDRSTQILESGKHEMKWEGADLSQLEGKPVRIHLEIRSACLYSIQFV